MRRRLLTFLLALALAAGLGAARPAVAHATGANDAIAINTKDDSSLFKFAWAVRHVMSDTVTEQNAAVAFAQCNSCQTTAIAIEIVLVQGPTSNLSPTNVALAINQGCNLCDTFASAYQFVILGDGPVRFTHDGLRELHDIRKEIQSWGKQGLTNAEIRARLPDLIARLKGVLATQLVPVHKGEEGEEPDESETDTTEGTTTPTPTSPTATTETGSVTTTAPTTTATTPTDTTTTGTTTTTP